MKTENSLVEGLTDSQRKAVDQLNKDTLVSAGAGSGKTRTLVARYLVELEVGTNPRQIAAITFTEKAAREMRNRIRSATLNIEAASENLEIRQRWRELANAMDGARIGTIHSLCAEILRSHPAEATLDPEFEVLEEGTARLLQHEAVEAALATAANDPSLVEVFRHFSPWALQNLLFDMLGRRLEVQAALRAIQTGVDGYSWLLNNINDFLRSQPVALAIDELRSMQAGGYFEKDATQSMAAMADELLSGWVALEGLLAADQPVKAAEALFKLRREAMKSGIGRRDGPARQAIDNLQTSYDRGLDLWLGGSSSRDVAPDPDLEIKYHDVLSRLTLVFLKALYLYRSELNKRAALDFDGLELGALELLQTEEVRARWQAAIKLVLVDEYQDTNGRQRQIIEALTGDKEGKLFVVGDARQSIYRFRGADVSIFQKLAGDLKSRGRSLSLDRTFRQHPALMAIFDRFLSKIMESEQPDDRFRVPYQGLKSDRSQAKSSTKPPYLEFIIGLGQLASDARPVAADMLAARLLSLWQEGELSSWEDVTLLFRASSGFSAYEDALSTAGIPYVTVAGRGFYNRPEIREVLNTLRALAEPWNQAAMVGLLRSAAIGLSDVGIYQLRVGDNGFRPLRQALEDVSIELSADDEFARQRALQMFDLLAPSVDRLPVAELLKKWMDWSDARAILAIAGERHWANLDKLLVDARHSGANRVRAFLDYIRLTQQAGVRQGEAPAEGSGSVRLMTIHKAKGLEFPFVVLADAGYQRRSGRPPFLVDPLVGLGLRPDLWQADGLSYRFALANEKTKEAAEEERLLYVALTRASEKVIISGHARNTKSGLRLSGWLNELLDAAEISAQDIGEGLSQYPTFNLWLADQSPQTGSLAQEAQEKSGEYSSDRPLFSPIRSIPFESTDQYLDEPAARAWRASGRRSPPAAVVGVLVHRAIERWMFPPHAGLEGLLRYSAIGEGLVERRPQQAAINIAVELLDRFRQHPIYQEIDVSDQRFHELPYTYQPEKGLPDSGAIDLLYLGNDGWRLLDFKTDALADPSALAAANEQHSDQIKRYILAARQLLGEHVRGAIVFLDAAGEVVVEEYIL